jgi:hypothetical protein
VYYFNLCNLVFVFYYNKIMQKAKSNKRSSLHVTPATTVGLTNTPS